MNEPPDRFSSVVERFVVADARAGRDHYPFGAAGGNLIAFCETLRQKHQFKLGPGEIAEALRALERFGTRDPGHARAALRAVCCSRLEDIEVFDWAFREFFFPAPQGVPQEGQPPLEDQPRKATPKNDDGATQETRDRAQAKARQEPSEDELAGQGQERRIADHDPAAQFMERLMRARFSALEAESTSPEIAADGLPEMLRAAQAFVSSVRIGRSRKWRIAPRGPRFDFRRTMRSSLATGGDAMHPRWLGHPRRNPRVLVLLDGSRSMLEHTAPVLQFAFALSQRSRRVDVFAFSTQLRDLTRDLARLSQQKRLRLELGPHDRSWGGGTRIGECLRTLLRDHGARVLTPNTVVLVSSDGLDVGETEVLEGAVRELRRRSAGVVWLNPLAAQDGYTPSARGMKAVAPHLTALTHASSPAEFAGLANGLRWR